jgi:alpha-beta hydrolase superfamily lysophospholipase
MDPPASRPFYLADGREQAFVVHQPAAGQPRGPAILFCAPFGWDEVCSYRIVREWSRRLSAAGHQSLRLTLPSAGDSAGMVGDPGRLDAWLRAVGNAARWLRTSGGAEAVVAVGLGLGGMLAYRAAAADAPIDGLVLWSVLARGRDFTRQLKAFSRMEQSEFFTDDDRPEARADGLEAGGFVLSAETLADLSALDLTTVELRGRVPLGVLALERDGLAIDARLIDALARDEVDVTTGPGEGYSAMTSHPQRSVVPEETFARVREWLRARPVGPATNDGPAAVPETRAHAELVLGDRVVRDTPFSLTRRSGGAVSGVLTTTDADGPLCAVFLNAGGVRRIGPNRMWVEAARRWAARGVPSLRLDAIGIGESDGAPTPYAEDGALYRPEFVPDVINALDELERQGVAQRFLLVGLCAGAYWSLYAGIEDPRVAGMVLLNPVVIVWDSGLGAARDVRRVFTERSWRLLRKNATPERMRAVAALVASAPRRSVKRLRSATGSALSIRDQSDATLERLLASGKHATMAFAVREPLPGELERSGWLERLQDAPQIDLRRVPVNDHTFRPTVIQAQVHAALDDGLAATQRATGDGLRMLTARP